jgi:hypothetical protein
MGIGSHRAAIGASPLAEKGGLAYVRASFLGRP